MLDIAQIEQLVQTDEKSPLLMVFFCMSTKEKIWTQLDELIVVDIRMAWFSLYPNYRHRI